MAYICDRCGKGRMRGRHITHHRGVAGGRWKRKAPKTKRILLPNLHVAWIIENGKRVKRRFCTSCLRLVKKEIAAKKVVVTKAA